MQATEQMHMTEMTRCIQPILSVSWPKARTSDSAAAENKDPRAVGGDSWHLTRGRRDSLGQDRVGEVRPAQSGKQQLVQLVE